MTKVAAIQMCSSHEVHENLQQVEQYINVAAKAGAKLVVLPEAFAAINLQPNDNLLRKENIGSGYIQDFVAQQAKKHKLWIVGGTIPIACDVSNKIRAATLVFDDNGMIVARYDKMHLFDVVISETEKYAESTVIQAGEVPVIISTPFGKVGLAVCYDIRFPELFRHYALHGVEIIIIPAAFTVKTGPHWDTLLKARAIENFSYVIGAAQAGYHTNGRSTYGNTAIISPWGDELAKMADQQPGVIYAEIDLAYLHKIRRDIPALTHRKKVL